MPYDANIERSEFIMRDYDRRDYRDDYDYRERDRSRRPVDPVERLAAVVNDPSIVIDPKMVKIINDPAMVMDRNGDVMKMQSPMQRSSFTAYPMLKTKRTRKKTKTDRTMSSCLKQANAKARKQNGDFKKGWDQSRMMSYAHKLCRKEMKGTLGTKKGMVRKTARRAYEKR